MNAILKKLNFKDQDKILVLNAPEEFLTNIKEIKEFTRVDEAVSEGEKYCFILVFVKECEDIVASVDIINNHLMDNDAILWFSYPKKSSKKYKTTINRDIGWERIGELNFEAVRQVAIDEDWSAIRFRETKYIKTLTRDKKTVISKEGKERLEAK